MPAGGGGGGVDMVRARGGSVRGAVVGGVRVAVAGAVVVGTVPLGDVCGGFVEAGFWDPVVSGFVGCVVHVDTEGRGARAGVDGGGRDDVVLAGRGRRGVVGVPRVDTVVLTRGVGGKGDLGNGRSR